MWDSIWDGILETGGELVTDVTDIGKKYLDIKVENEAKRVESSNPDEQRKHNNEYQQPTGEPVTPAKAGVNPTYVALGAVFLVLLMLAVFYIAKGRK